MLGCKHYLLRRILRNQITPDKGKENSSPEVSVNGYKSPSGEYRVGLVGAGEVVGYEKTWVSQMVGTGDRLINMHQLNPLPAKGLTDF